MCWNIVHGKTLLININSLVMSRYLRSCFSWRVMFSVGRESLEAMEPQRHQTNSRQMVRRTCSEKRQEEIDSIQAMEMQCDMCCVRAGKAAPLLWDRVHLLCKWWRFSLNILLPSVFHLLFITASQGHWRSSMGINRFWSIEFGFVTLISMTWMTMDFRFFYCCPGF